MTNSNSLEPISVLICTRNRPDDIVQVMPQIMAQDYPDYEVVLIDQSTNGDSERRVKAQFGNDPRLRYIRTDTKGLSIARNLAMQEARYDLCAFTDDDVEVPTNWLSNIHAAFVEHPDTDVLYGPVIIPRDLVGKPDLHFPCLYFDEARLLRKGEIFGMGANMALRKRFFRKVGPFDVLLGTGGLFPGAEEHDWLYRAHRIDGKIRLEPKTCIEHRAWRTTEQWVRSNYMLAYGDGAFAAKHLRCGDIAMLGFILKRLLIMSARTCRRVMQRRYWRIEGIYAWRYWLGVWGSLKYRIDKSARLFESNDLPTAALQ